MLNIINFLPRENLGKFCCRWLDLRMPGVSLPRTERTHTACTAREWDVGRRRTEILRQILVSFMPGTEFSWNFSVSVHLVLTADGCQLLVHSGTVAAPIPGFHPHFVFTLITFHVAVNANLRQTDLAEASLVGCRQPGAAARGEAGHLPQPQRGTSGPGPPLQLGILGRLWGLWRRRESTRKGWISAWKQGKALQGSFWTSGVREKTGVCPYPERGFWDKVATGKEMRGAGPRRPRAGSRSWPARAVVGGAW